MPTFFATPSEFRNWFEGHHDEAKELWVEFHKKSSGKLSITWPEAVDQALCFGWIDGIRKGIDDVSYAIRFTPRQPHSTWSTVNIKRAEALSKLGQMRPAGLNALTARRRYKSGIYSYEQRKTASLSKTYAQQFRADKTAWAFFQSQAPWYRRTAIWWVVSAKKEETSRKRLATLIRASARGQTIPPLTRPTRPK